MLARISQLPDRDVQVKAMEAQKRVWMGVHLSVVG